MIKITLSGTSKSSPASFMFFVDDLSLPAKDLLTLAHKKAASLVSQGIFDDAVVKVSISFSCTMN